MTWIMPSGKITVRNGTYTGLKNGKIIKGI
jgi:hypothetical protein